MVDYIAPFAEDPLERTLFEADSDEEHVDAPLGSQLFKLGTPAPRHAMTMMERADEDAWLAELGEMQGEVARAKITAAYQVKHTERQAARLAEVMSRTCEGRVAAARRWAEQEAAKHQASATAATSDWVQMVAQAKAETGELRKDVKEAHAQSADLRKQLADSALRLEKQKRAAEKELAEAVSAARREAEDAAAARIAAGVSAADASALRAERRLAEVSDELAETQAAAQEQQAQHRVEIAAKDAQLAEASAQQAELTARAEAAELEAEALQAEVVECGATLEQLTLRAEARQAEHEEEVQVVLEQAEATAQESTSLGRLLAQRSAELVLLRERQQEAQRRLWLRLCAGLLVRQQRFEPERGDGDDAVVMAPSSPFLAHMQVLARGDNERASRPRRGGGADSSDSDDGADLLREFEPGRREADAGATLRRRILEPSDARSAAVGAAGGQAQVMAGVPRMRQWVVAVAEAAATDAPALVCCVAVVVVLARLVY